MRVKIRFRQVIEPRIVIIVSEKHKYGYTCVHGMFYTMTNIEGQIVER